MEKRDPLREVGNVPEINEPQETSKETKQAEILTSSEKENSFSPCNRNDSEKLGKPNKPRPSLLQAFDPLYSSPEVDTEENICPVPEAEDLDSTALPDYLVDVSPVPNYRGDLVEPKFNTPLDDDTRKSAEGQLVDNPVRRQLCSEIDSGDQKGSINTSKSRESIEITKPDLTITKADASPTDTVESDIPELIVCVQLSKGEICEVKAEREIEEVKSAEELPENIEINDSGYKSPKQEVEVNVLDESYKSTVEEETVEKKVEETQIEQTELCSKLPKAEVKEQVKDDSFHDSVSTTPLQELEKSPAESTSTDVVDLKTEEEEKPLKSTEQVIFDQEVEGDKEIGNVSLNEPVAVPSPKSDSTTVSGENLAEFDNQEQDIESSNSYLLNREASTEPIKNKIIFDTEAYNIKMADINDLFNEQQQQISDLKLQLNAAQQAKASLELEIRQKEEVIIKTQAEALKNEQMYKQENKQLQEKLKENSKLIEKDSSKELEDQLKEAKGREAKALAELNHISKEQHEFQKIMEEYENLISTRFAEFKKMKEERDTATRHLANVELAFSDVHQKYERAKNVLLGFKSNEEALKLELQNSEKMCKQHEEKYESLKSHAKAQIENANKEILTLRDKYENDINKLKAVIKRLEIKCSSLDISLQQKTEECAALSALCDEVTGKRV